MTEFEELMEIRDKYYKKGYYGQSIYWATRAIELARNKEEMALALNARAWGERYVGYKADDPMVKDKMYALAKGDWTAVLETMPEDIDVVISAIKGFMLLPGNDVEELYKLGAREIEKRIVDDQTKDNLKADLINSMGIIAREKDPEVAERIFLQGYEIVESGITTAGHLINNAGVCHLILKNQAEEKNEKYLHAKVALEFLTEALDHYPLDQIEHRRAAQKKIDNTLKEIENNFE